MDLGNTLLLLAFGQGLLISLALLAAGILKRNAQKYLGLILWVIALEIGTIWAIRSEHVSTIFPFWIFGSYLLLPPALLLFFENQTTPDFRSLPKHIWLFAPAIIEIAVEGVVRLHLEMTGNAIELIQNPVWFSFTEVLPVVGLIVVMVRIGYTLQKLYRVDRSLTSRSLARSRTKVTTMFTVLGLITLLWVLETWLQLPVFRITLGFLCFLIFGIGFLVFFRPDLFQVPVYPLLPSGDPDEQIEQLQRIQKAFNTEKIFLEPRLTLKKAADYIGLPPRQISEAINRQEQMDFRRYVNHLRVQEVIHRVEAGERSQKTLLGIALESGFNANLPSIRHSRTSPENRPPNILGKWVQKRVSGRP